MPTPDQTWTVVDLRTFARTNHINLHSASRKADILEHIREFLGKGSVKRKSPVKKASPVKPAKPIVLSKPIKPIASPPKTKQSNKRTKQVERREKRTKALTENIIFFNEPNGMEKYRNFSPWSTASFYDGNDNLFINAAQYIVYCKALLSEDLATAQAVLKAKSQDKINKLNDQIKGFDINIWDQNKDIIVERANYFKFTQNPIVNELLKRTDDALLVYANPDDADLGIGMTSQQASNVDPSAYIGQNVLGKAIMRVRSTINLNLN